MLTQTGTSFNPIAMFYQGIFSDGHFGDGTDALVHTANKRTPRLACTLVKLASCYCVVV